MSLPFKVGQRVVETQYAIDHHLHDGAKKVVSRPVRGTVVGLTDGHAWPMALCIGGPCVRVQRDGLVRPSWYFCKFWRRPGSAKR